MATTQRSEPAAGGAAKPRRPRWNGPKGRPGGSGRSGRTGYGRGEARFGIAMALPALIVTLVLLAYPLAYSFWVSLHEQTLGSRAPARWVGFDNYTAVLSDPVFLPSLTRTVLFAAVVVVGTLVLGTVFALALNQDFRGRSVVRGVLILPWSLSQITLALTFGWIFNSTFGPLNGALKQAGLIDKYVAWFASGQVALAVMAVAFVWSLVPFATLLILGALQTVPEDLHKAARIDGAGPVRRFFFVTLPWIRDTMLVVSVLALINAFLAFALIYILTGGGPGTETTLLSWWGYTTAFRDLDLGKGAAIFYLMTLAMVLLAALTALGIRGPRRRREGRTA
ncbi:sugar ABC transporter permease [Actinomadura sp. KC216]|uniref:carbohydrate ABC transporter permease n=1 Tax=Actinomadura sp. KC216 TaxID=2530370 RepID=UPI00104EA3BB|nr:sugar ABC transporter permease [Actinomadura sp. KC216]TDB89027.1 sugar ABC transporter permease [Actinomadura sp. KC216]